MFQISSHGETILRFHLWNLMASHIYPTSLKHSDIKTGSPVSLSQWRSIPLAKRFTNQMPIKSSVKWKNYYRTCSGLCQGKEHMHKIFGGASTIWTLMFLKNTCINFYQILLLFFRRIRNLELKVNYSDFFLF